MPAQHHKFPPCHGVPHPRRRVVRPNDDAVAVWAEGIASDATVRAARRREPGARACFDPTPFAAAGFLGHVRHGTSLSIFPRFAHRMGVHAICLRPRYGPRHVSGAADGWLRILRIYIVGRHDGIVTRRPRRSKTKPRTERSAARCSVRKPAPNHTAAARAHDLARRTHARERPRPRARARARARERPAVAARSSSAPSAEAAGAEAATSAEAAGSPEAATAAVASPTARAARVATPVAAPAR